MVAVLMSFCCGEPCRQTMVAVFGKRWPWPPYVFARLCSFAANHPEIAAKEHKERNDFLIFTVGRQPTSLPGTESGSKSGKIKSC